MSHSVRQAARCLHSVLAQSARSFSKRQAWYNISGNADKIGVAFSKFNTFVGLCCSNQAEKMLKYIEDFSKKAKTQTKL
jgi:hypothetical protein